MLYTQNRVICEFRAVYAIDAGTLDPFAKQHM